MKHEVEVEHRVRLDEIKQHVKEHWKLYTAGTTIVLAGITWTIVRGRCAVIPSVADGSDVITTRPLAFFSKQQNNIVN